MTVVNTSRSSLAVEAGDADEKPAPSPLPIPKSVSVFDRYSNELAQDQRVQTEIAAGKRIGFYRLLNTIGSGNFSQVKLGTHVITHEKVAVKILDKMKLSSKTQRLLSKEISSMERLQHPHIIRLYEVMETMTKMYMVIEYASGGELFTNITTKGKFKEDDAKVIYAQIVSAVEHMHEKQVIHRDIKAENVFITNTLYVKVGDFGFSALARPDQTLNTFCGSPPYAAPELFKDDYYFGGLVDIWALGVLLYFIVTGVTPFRADTVPRLKASILAGTYSVPAFMSAACRQLVAGLLQQTPSQRLTLVQIKESEWMAGQEFPLALRHYEINPRVRSRSSQRSEVTPTATPNSESADEFPADEVEVHRQLRRLGITDELLQRSNERSSRSSVTGVYRIVLHQLQRRRYCSTESGPRSASAADSSNAEAERRRDTSSLCVLL